MKFVHGGAHADPLVPKGPKPAPSHETDPSPSTLFVVVNRSHITVQDPDPNMTLLELLRTKMNLTGTKLGCAEGGCGACTVVVGSKSALTGKSVYKAVNACLMPAVACDGTHVVTVEGIGNTKNPHPVQERLAFFNGSQCGFCTPGIVMAMYALLRNNPKPTMAEVEENFSGNLCRCTGYRPILEAYKTFAVDYPRADETCKPTVVQGTPDKVQLCSRTGQACNCNRFAPFEPAADLIFPPILTTHKHAPLYFPGEKSVWYRPVSLGELKAIKARHPKSKFVVGNTEVGIETKFKHLDYPVMVSTTHVPELNSITDDGDKGIHVGPSVSLNDFAAALKERVNSLDSSATWTFKALLHQLHVFAGNQVRNVACVGGNIVTASPISDMNPVFAACGAEFILMNAKTGAKRSVPASKFFIKYRVVDMSEEEFLYSVFVPRTRPMEYVQAFKQARRKEDDIAIVSAAFRVVLEAAPPGSGGGMKVVSAHFGYGGMAPKTVTAPGTEELLKGRSWSKAMLEDVYKALAKDLPLPEGAPGGMIEYRRALTTSFFYKFFLAVNDKFANYLGASVPALSPAEKCALKDDLERPLSKGNQSYEVDATRSGPVGLPVSHMAALQQTTGEAQYTDDIGSVPGTLYGAIVWSTKAHAKILSVDPAAALKLPGVERYVGAADVAGANKFGPIVKDEEIFATKEVVTMGQPIGMILADTYKHAQAGAHAVMVKYEDLPVVLSIEDAIAANSFHDTVLDLERGEVDATLASAPYRASGRMHVGGQEHFYLETQVSYVIPGEDNEFIVHTSTQNPTKTQDQVAKALGIPANRVVAKTKRMGGGFGGKETRSVYLSCAVAVASQVTGRPVRCMLDRDEDMYSSGTRHPFMADWQVGFDENGKVLAMDIKLYSNAGCSMDLSAPVMERALFHVDNAYYIPHVRAVGRLAKTNIPTNTAFRGFGGPQGMIFAEEYMDAIARYLGKDRSEVQAANFYKEGELTHYLQKVENNQLPSVWKQMSESGDGLAARRAAVDAFNKSHRWRKRGLATVPVKFGMSFTIRFMNQAGALVHAYQDGTVLVSHGGTEMGQGLHTKMAQVAAGALGIPLKDVYINETSTDKVANTSPTAASVQSDINGMAVLNACNALNERLEPLKAKFPDASFGELCLQAHLARINLSANGFYRTPDVGYDFHTHEGRPFNYFSFGAAVSEVEIDTLTGDHTVLRTDICFDVGKSLNPAIDLGQIEGAFVQGYGMMVLEEQVWLKNGFLLTRGPGAYKIPSFTDIPLEFNVSLLRDAPNPRAIHSSKGIGEPPLFLACSVLYALKDACAAARAESGKTGPFTLHSPATAERIRNACEDNFTAQFATSKSVPPAVTVVKQN